MHHFVLGRMDDVTPRRARLYRALFWSTSVIVITVIATATLQLLAPDPPEQWAPILDWLPDYLVPEYSTADLPPVVLTILAAAAVLVGISRWIVGKLRHRARRLPPLTPEEIESLSPKEHFDAVIAERGTRLQRTSTWGVVFGLLFTAGSLVYTARSLETSQEGQITDRYTKAVEQLSSKTIDVRLGAIYALQRLAQDSERDRRTIVNVMAAYVREHDPKPKAKRPLRPKTDVQAALTVLGTVYLRPGEALTARNACYCDLAEVRIPHADLYGLNFRQADLREADLSRVDLRWAGLSGADLREAFLSRAGLRRADLSEADLRRAVLRGADLSGAGLRGADLSEADLRLAVLRGAVLSGTILRGADLSEADLRGADLSEADLRGTILRGTILREANLNGADLSGANLSKADLSEEDLSGAKTDDKTQLPPGVHVT
ncbi:pentapeptide repeat-containing protein [Actinomadura luzonensis]|uniref:pentapeptide repeat-containing protein n=1 Tax=Actinomadura luzonensis TaxID=2805427 RepID=UPI002674D642|nr:pentapeptide repeat-containing protein [Actinomadura luzonensis]